MSERAVTDIRPHVHFQTNDDQSVTAIYSRNDVHVMCTGTDKKHALQSVLSKLNNEQPEVQRPWLQLCTPCNKRAAALGTKAETDGVEVCVKCAAAIDKYEEAIEQWRDKVKRKKRNAAKRQRKARRR